MDFDGPSKKQNVMKDVQKKRAEREAARVQQTQETQVQEQQEIAAARIARFFRTYGPGRRVRDAEWQSLQKQAGDLDKLGTQMKQKGQLFVAPSKVLLPLIRRVLLQHRWRNKGVLAEVCGQLGTLLAAGLRTPLDDSARSICALLEAVAPEKFHVPLVMVSIMRFVKLLFESATSAGSAVGPRALAEILDVGSWGRGSALQQHPPSKAVADGFLDYLLATASCGTPGLQLWRNAAKVDIATWPGGHASAASERILQLVRVGVCFFRLDNQFLRSPELMEQIVGVPRIGILFAAAVEGNPLDWRQILRSYYFTRIAGAQRPVAEQRILDREYTLVYLFGNLLEVNSHTPLPLDPLLLVLSLLSENVEVSMLPGAPSQSVDEPLPVKALRQQLRHLSDKSSIANLFGKVLGLQSSQECKAMRPYQRHCRAVLVDEINPVSVEALCTIYSTMLQKATNSMKAGEAGFGNNIFFLLANNLAFMEQGDLAKVLWRFARGFYEWHGTQDWQTLGCYHVLHLQSCILAQLLQTTADSELRGEASPLCELDFSQYISCLTALMARLVWNGDAGAGGQTDPRGGCKAQLPLVHNPTPNVPKGLFLEAFLIQGSKVLSQLKSTSARHKLPFVDSPNVWHAPLDILHEFQKALHSNSWSERLRAKVERLLRYAPHCVSFEQRVQLLRSWIQADRDSARQHASATRVVIRRTHIFEDGLVQLMSGRANWKGQLHIQFVSENGRQEAGQDVGGLFKEYWEKLAETAFNPDYGLFRMTEDRLLYPNAAGWKYHERPEALLTFLGLIVGKAIFEGIVIEPVFASFFLSKLLGKHNSYYDLQSLDPALFKNLQQVKGYDGDVSDLCCSFVATNEDGTEIPLLPNGENLTVTNESRYRYIYLLSDHKLNTELKAASDAFKEGFRQLCDDRWLRMFGEAELQQVISGDSEAKGFDVDDLRKNTRYSNCEGPKDKLVLDLWKAVEALSDDKRTQFLRFVTSCSRTPLLGFTHLVPPFTVHKIQIRKDSERLPTASTCFNMLKLPTYSSWKVMKQKIEFVCDNGAGFELE